MKPYIIFGVSTVAGSELARTLRHSHRVIGISETESPEIANCEMISGSAATKNLTQLLTDLAPARVIDASTAGDSIWNPEVTIGSAEQCRTSEELASWCASQNVGYTLLSSDGVMSGPWIFHEEDSASFSQSVVGQRLLQLEQRVQEIHPEALIIRTHPIGWNRTDSVEGWLESMLDQMMQGNDLSHLSRPGHSTPIAASELAVIVERALSEKLTGMYHIGGAERVHRLEFGRKLAQQFDIGWFGPRLQQQHFTDSERQSFGCGETSLHTRKIRRTLCVAMPTLSESFQKLRSEMNEVESVPMSRAA